MGNLIKDFWTYQYKDRKYFGIVEVCGDYKHRSEGNKRETHIDKALDYTMKNQCMSHMSLQTYVRFLKDATRRGEYEETYYPFTLEFEHRYPAQQKEAIYEAYKAATHLIYEMDIEEQDLLILLNNSRSTYIMVNPKSYGLKPSVQLHEIYRKMYDVLNQELNLRFVDMSFFSHNKLLKTPNCYYNGGYFVRITYKELRELNLNNNLRKKLTAERRSLDISVPAAKSWAFTKLYENARENASKAKRKVEKKSETGSRLTYLKSSKCKCVEYIENNIIKSGNRNRALVSVAYSYKKQGYSLEQVTDILTDLANKWDYDEVLNSKGDIQSIAKSIFRGSKSFNCTQAKDLLDQIDMPSLCAKCPFNQKNLFRNNTIPVSAKIINELWDNGAGTRHFVAYLKMLYHDLFNGEFDAAQYGLSDRTLRDMVNYCPSLSRRKKKGMVYISHPEKVPGQAVYYLPKSFIDDGTTELLGEYLKHYLKLLIKGYKPFNTYIMLRVGKEKLKRDFGYKGLSGVYKLLTKLEKLGLIIQKKNHTILLYYKTYKVVQIKDYKNEKSCEATKQSIAIGYNIGITTSNNYKKLQRGEENSRGSPSG